jgi:NADH dehydrogenase
MAAMTEGSMSQTTRVLIVGGGYAGVWAGKLLEKRFRKDATVEITLVDRNHFHTLMTELHEVAAHRVEPESIVVPFRKIFGGRRIAVVQDSISTIDFEAKLAKGDKAEYPFDYVVLGSGAQPEYFGLPGVRQNSFTLWSYQDAIRLRRHLDDVWERALREADPAKRRALLTFAVAGSGFTGIELVGELLEYRDAMCRKYHIDRAEVKLAVIEALPSIVPILEDPLRAKAAKYLKRHDVDLLTNTTIVGAEPGAVKFKDGGALATETFVWTCGVMGSNFAGMLDLTKGKCGNRECGIQRAQGTCGCKDCQFKKLNPGVKEKAGRLLVDEYMRSPDYKNVYVVGDNCFFLENGKPLPQIVEAAHQTAEVAAHNIEVAIGGKGSDKRFKSNFHGFMVSLGGRYGVSNAGGMKTSGFFAMAMKHLINLWYLFSIAGVNQAWEYLKHEFLDIKDRRSIIGGFAERKTRGYWVAVARMWLGFHWTIEAINKITEGWLDFSTGSSKSGWMFLNGVKQAGVPVAITPEAANAVSAATEAAGGAATSAADAISAASDAAGAATSAADAISAASDAGWDGASEAASEVASAASTAYGKLIDPTSAVLPIDSGIVQWFQQTFMAGIFAHIPYDIFQAMVVMTELLIGLALFGGAFTWVAALASLGMCVVFILSGFFYWYNAWMIFAAILCLGGAGRAFGLDYWIVPFLKRWWAGTKFARRTHLYTGDPSK